MPTGQRFTHDDRQILASFADQAAIAVQNAQLYQEHLAGETSAGRHSGVHSRRRSDPRPAYRIVVFNRALARLTGWSADEVLGKHHDEVIRWARLETEYGPGQRSRRGLALPAARPLYVEGDLRRRNGGTVSVGITYAPLFDYEGHLVNVICNVRDITRFREADEIKSTFISVVSHELKTPVALIKGYADTLLREDAHWDPKTRETA